MNTATGSPPAVKAYERWLNVCPGVARARTTIDVPTGTSSVVGDRRAVVGHLIGGVDEVPGSDAFGQGQAAGDVVVVDVGLEHVADPHALLGGQVEDAVDVALGIDHERHLAVVDEIAAITQGRGLDRDDRRDLLAGPLGAELIISVTFLSGCRCRPGGGWTSRQRCRR